MERFAVDGVELEYEVAGQGDAVVLIHGSHIAGAFRPLVEQPAMAGYRRVRYHRRGFAGSTKVSGALSLARQASDCEALLQHLGIGRAHVVGHSYGGAIALQLAKQSPGVVHSLVLEEPALLAVPSGEAFFAQVMPIIELYAGGDPERAVHSFLELVSRPGSEAIVDATVPGGVAQAVKDADTFFQIELPALQEWSFTAEDASAIDQPVLHVLGADSASVFQEGADLIQSWMAQAEVARIPDACHLLQMERPAEVAKVIAAFLGRHPIAA